MKPCRIMDWCRGNKPLYVGVDHTQNEQMAAILDFRVTHHRANVILCLCEYP